MKFDTAHKDSERMNAVHTRKKNEFGAKTEK